MPNPERGTMTADDIYTATIASLCAILGDPPYEPARTIAVQRALAVTMAHVALRGVDLAPTHERVDALGAAMLNAVYDRALAMRWEGN